MVVVGPLGEVVCKFEPGEVGAGVFKINDDELFVLVFGLEQGRLLIIGADTEDVAVLCLCDMSESETQW